MRYDTKPTDAGAVWAAYEPDDEAPWDLRRVAHLHRRAGFAATWGELQRDLKDGPKASIERLLAGKARADGVPKDFADMAGLLARSAGDAERLKAWWVYRMLFGPDPLTERLALLWHNHFATSIAKVRDAGTMRRQNEVFRESARAPFGTLLAAATHDPALLLWLDAPANRQGHPNENLARELMELFTLGIGHYTEADVKEAARALTGWTVAEDRFREEAERHDDGDKTILGRCGKWTGDDLVKMLLGQSATAERLAFRLCEQFMGEGGVDAAGVKALAAGLREHELNVGWGVETVLRSRAFFAAANLGRRVTAPAEFAVGAARALEMFEPAPSTLVLADWSARLGQDLFQPPNVGGWPGGRTWVSAQSMIGRANFAAALVGGALTRDRQPFDAVGLARRHGRGGDLRELIAFYGDLLLTAAAPNERIAAALGAGAKLSAETARRAVVLILASPEAQLAESCGRPHHKENTMHSRRDFLKRASLVALAPMVPAFLARTARAAAPDKDGRILVVIQLDGGNDGINTVVPFADEGYAKCRRALRLPREQLVKVNDGVGLHPAMGDAGRLLESQRLAIVQAVGYSNPNRSHFESMAIWHTARFDPEERNGLGWIGRGLDDDRPPAGGVPAAVFVGGGQMPVALRGRRSVASGLTRPEDFVLAPEAKAGPAGLGAEPKDDLLAFVRRSALDGYATADRMAEVVRAAAGDARYPETELGKQMGLMARLIKGGIGTRVYYARQSGYDTHAAQLGPHAALLRELCGALKAFLDDLAAARLAERVTVLAFSEFGRTVKENGSAGTDHGTAGPLFLAGPCVKPGLVGTMPKLLDPDPKHGDLRLGLDFRRVYAAVLEEWLRLSAKSALGAEFESLPLFRA